ncbi:hypothetical protein HG535_0A02080 [Zygotorulaspora mrakii]|uniref:Flo11 domain-containing protein n=1 Tax=Zygotorulaspora mrakii TaxID=42260 RepID=A0A7H9AVA4_ZYGMR|nr:uncharacterized protein HG535_0A02080 [Zygotorulaspora mrakii]QLG70270.1 hypothetical protein HG535_0A02080 [Zygotorulaspora mrakii]
MKFSSFLLAAVVSVAVAVRFDIKNATCTNLHGRHCGTYALRVVGTNDTFLGVSTFVGSEALSGGAEYSWDQYLNQKPGFLTRLTTVGTNETANFKPITMTTTRPNCNVQSIDTGMIAFANTVTNEISFNDWAYTAFNSSVPTALANQLMNSTSVGVQCAQCWPGFTSTLLSTPTVNIFSSDDILPPWCSEIEFEPVCPAEAGFA